MKKLQAFTLVTCIAVGSWCLLPEYLTFAGSQGLTEHIKTFEKGNALERERSILRLSEFQDDRVMETILDATQDQAPYVRHAAAWAIVQHVRVRMVGRPIKSFQYSAIGDALLPRLKDKDLWVKIQAIEALSQIEWIKQQQGLQADKRVREAIRTSVTDPNPYVREVAINQFVMSDPPKELDVLRAAFQDKIWLIRAQVASDALSPKTKIDTLIEASRDESPLVRRAAIYELRQIYKDEPRAVEALLERLGDPSGESVAWSMFGLAEFKEPRAVRPLLDLLAEGWEDRSYILRALEDITGKPANEVVAEHQAEPKQNIRGRAPVNRPSQIDIQRQLEILERGDRNQRVSAILRLTWAETPSSEEALMKALQDSDPEIRMAAVGALSASPMPLTRDRDRVINLIFSMTKDQHPRVRQRAIDGLFPFLFDKYRERGVNLLHVIVQNEEDPFVKSSAVQVLRHHSPADRVLIKLLTDEFSEVRQRAAWGINLACLPAAFEPMVKALNDPVPQVRNAVVGQFGNADYSKAVPVVKKIAKNDPAKFVQDHAMQTLNSLETRRRLGKAGCEK
jgi:HEAT repeat protein